MNANKVLTKAISSLIIEHPFYATLLLYLKVVEDDSIETMGTDGNDLVYSPKWASTLPFNQLKGVLAHEALHCAFMHHTRRGDRDFDIWNEACDYVINPVLLKAGFQLPDGMLISPHFEGMGAEEVYARIGSGKPKQLQPMVGQNGIGHNGPTMAVQPGMGSLARGVPAMPAMAASGQILGQIGQAKPGTFGPCPPGGIFDAAPQHEVAALGEATAEWDRRIQQALSVAKGMGAGTLPGGISEVAVAMNKPLLSSREVLRRFINDRTQYDYSWSRPDKRLLNSGIYVPSIIPDGIKKLGVVIDTSGSINSKLLNQFYSDLQLAMEEGAIQELALVQCDTKVQHVARYNAGDAIDFEVYGRGGTMFGPALEWFKDNEPDVAALIYFTDLDCSDYGEEPLIPLLWYAYGMESELDRLIPQGPFGEVIKVQI